MRIPSDGDEESPVARIQSTTTKDDGEGAIERLTLKAIYCPNLRGEHGNKVTLSKNPLAHARRDIHGAIRQQTAAGVEAQRH